MVTLDPNNPFIKKYPISREGLSSKEKQVLGKLEKAAELIAPVYASQINDQYPGANFYPHDATRDEILAAAQSNPLILNPYTIVERGEDGSLITVPYHVKYIDQLKPVIKLIREAAEITENREFSKRLEVQADALEKGTYEAADIYWLSIKPYKIDIIIGPSERYEDRLFFKKTCYSAVAGVIDEKATQKAEEIRDILFSPERKTFSLSQKVESDHRLQVRIDQSSVLSGLDARASFAGAFLPNDPHLIENYGAEVIVFSTSSKENFQKLFFPIFKKIFEENFQKSYTEELLADSSQKLVLIREIVTNLVKYHDTEKRLGELYPVINEAASFILAIKSSGVLLLKDVITQKELEGMIIMLLCRACDVFVSSKEIKSLTHYSQGYAIMVNYFLKNGALREHEGISWVNFTKMFVALNDLAGALERILAFGDREDVKKLMLEYGDVTPCLKISPKI